MLIFFWMKMRKISFQVAEFEEDDIVIAQLKGGTSAAPDPKTATLRLELPANAVEMGPLQIGKDYHVILTEMSGKEERPPRTEVVDFRAGE